VNGTLGQLAGKVESSRKLTGLIIVLASLLVLSLLAVIAMWALGVGWELFAAIGTQITTLGGAHQAAQSMQDRAQAYSPSYPNAPGPPRTPTGQE
jgi:ABC-type nickel/cobalt efflux system permease component RcnA